jgi:hypothetical protein
MGRQHGKVIGKGMGRKQGRARWSSLQQVNALLPSCCSGEGEGGSLHQVGMQQLPASYSAKGAAWGWVG